MRVLERIVTDERFDLKQQFKDLEALRSSSRRRANEPSSAHFGAGVGFAAL